jgi:hypothetical protein
VHYNNTIEAQQRMNQQLEFITFYFNEHLNRLAKKRARQEVRQGMLCEYINPRNQKPCSSYKTTQSNFCHCHQRLNPYGDNHIFSKRNMDEEVKSPPINETLEGDFDDILEQLLNT